MLKLLSVFTCCLLLTSFLPAQTWQPFRAGRGYEYDYDLLGTYYRLQVDSVKLESGDSAYYFNRIAKPLEVPIYLGSTCPGYYLGMSNYQTDMDNFFGQKMIRRPGGEYWFVLGSVDTMKINITAPVGSSWSFYPGITATLAAKYLGNVSGVPDSLLKIGLSTSDTITISKSFGLVSSYGFQKFLPGAVPPGIFLYLRGIREVGLGNWMPSFAETFNFDIGDQFDYEGRTESGPFTIERWYIRYKIFSKYVSTAQDTFQYQAQETYLYFMLPPFGSDTVWVPLDTITLTYTLSDYEILDRGTMEYIPGPPSPDAEIAPLFTHGEYFSLFTKDLAVIDHYHVYDTCFGYLSKLSLEEGEIQKYASGLGEIHADGYFSNFTYRDMVCYRKLADSAGSCHDFSVLLEREPSAPSHVLNVYPNPSSDALTVTYNGTPMNILDIVIFDRMGREVKRESCQNLKQFGNQTLDISGLAPGLYLLSLTGTMNPVTVRIRIN